MIRQAVAALVILMAAACMQEQQADTTTGETQEPAPVEAGPVFPPLPRPGPLEATAGRVLRIDIVEGREHVIDGKTPNFFRVEGYAPADWFFEAAFPIRLEVDGQVMVEFPALSLDDWTNGEPWHPYRATVSFDLAEETEAVLVLEEDMPKHDAEGNELPLSSVRIPVVLAPVQ